MPYHILEIVRLKIVMMYIPYTTQQNIYRQQDENSIDYTELKIAYLLQVLRTLHLINVNIVVLNLRLKNHLISI